MSIITRTIQEKIEKSLFKGKIVVIYGARQVGKTTLVKEIQKKYNTNSVYYNCEERDIAEVLTNKTSTELKAFIGSKKLIILDEAQKVKNIGLTLKLLIDNFPDIQVIATGSSSFDLANRVNEPLTGRKREFILYPISLQELKTIYNDLEIDRLLERFLVYGFYPEIISHTDQATENLHELANSYVYKDILSFDSIRNSEVLQKLLQALALQMGNEVSFNELADTVGGRVSPKTIERYIKILEQAFIIYRLPSFSGNLRNELKHSRKIYFFDNGIRNALIKNLNPINLRQDIGALWESFLLSERLKNNANNGLMRNAYFWRGYQQKEVDYIEQGDGQLTAYEFKWGVDKTYYSPKDFVKAYKTEVIKIDRSNFRQFI